MKIGVIYASVTLAIIKSIIAIELCVRYESKYLFLLS